MKWTRCVVISCTFLALGVTLIPAGGCSCGQRVGLGVADAGAPVDAAVTPDAAILPDAVVLPDAGPAPADGPCVNTLATTLAGFGPIRVATGSFIVDALSGEINVSLASDRAAVDRIDLALSIPASWSPAVATVRLFTGASQLPYATMEGSGGAGIDLYQPGDRLRAWFDLTFSGGRLSGSVEVLAATASCEIRRCFNGERLGQGDSCCCGGVYQSPFSDVGVDTFCTGYQVSSSPPEGVLQGCQGCPPSYVCAAEPGDPATTFCRAACTENRDCPLWESCVAGGCRPARCERDTDCGDERRCISPLPGLSYCSGQNFNGTDPCLPALQSVWFATLGGNFCGLACAADVECPAGWICSHRTGDVSASGWCAPECTARTCGTISADFAEALGAARACQTVGECVGSFAGCGLWLPHWEHCSGYLMLGANADIAGLDGLNAEWAGVCLDYPQTLQCASCDADPVCSPTCSASPGGAGVCVGNCL